LGRISFGLNNRNYLVSWHEAILEKNFWLAYSGLGSIADFDHMTVEERDWNLHKLKEVKEEEKKQHEEAVRKSKAKTSGSRAPRRY